ncbi:GAF domain-containing protein [Exiguobacterium sp. s143]|uniref:GAF domain-containing protein n=1 Tax=Exiguobacterium sp. s143 TaxID=2751201 RepID=UPI001BE57389|nr:GAF domain-containing protein [Exiguobacterium sp. s143]
MNKKINENEVELSPLPLSKKIVSYLVALLLLIVILYTALTAFSEPITFVLQKLNLISNDQKINKITIYSTVSIIFLTYRIVSYMSRMWRRNEKIEIGTAVTSFPNPFFDPTFEKNQDDLQNKYSKLTIDYARSMELLNEANEIQDELKNNLIALENRLRIMIRHISNSNRVTRSLNYALHHKTKYSTEECLKIVLEECITILEKDQSDKSITLFGIENEELKIVSSVRINLESVDKRKFRKGEGFAGYIWGINKPEIINNINFSDSRFSEGGLPVTKIGSIMGFPLNVDGEILGVFCLQSEVENGFVEEDLLTIEFYARICTLILLYDKLKLD